ncbi:MliC family protein [Halalkalibaculum sp. DA3122]|uniref:MliC family protein n=1 Tax=Halalkalibaculum sp. DA3122 TaxID=3373607 RepID=UPI003753F1EB
MRSRLLLSLLLLFSLSFTGCTGSTEKDQLPGEVTPSAPQPTGKTLVYDCLVEWDLVVKVDTSDAWLILPDTTVHLPRRRSASGARFMSEGGDYMYWSKGDDAIIEIDDKSYGYCDLDPEEAVWQDAKFRGAAFRASGFEPGWHLELFPDTTTFVLDYGEYSFSAPTTEPDYNPDSTETVYQMNAADHHISIRITAEECIAPSGKEFPSTTLLTVDDKTYRGCGRSFE